MINSVAVVGLGNIARRHRNNLRIRLPNVRILAMPASNRVVNEKAENVDKMISCLGQLVAAKPDFAIIASPASFHAIHALAMIEAGVPVLIEKPLTSSVADAQAICDAATKYQVKAAVGYCLRYLPSAQRVKNLLDNGALGPVYSVFINVGQYLPDWRQDRDYQNSVSVSAALGGGVLAELSHEFDYMQWLLGDLQLQFAQLRNSIELDLEVEEIADLVLTTSSGTVCHMHLDFLQKQAHRHCSFIGAGGRLDWDLQKNTVSLHGAAGDSSVYADPKWDKNQMYLAMLDDFLSSRRNSDHLYANIDQASRTVSLISEIKARAQWGLKQ